MEQRENAKTCANCMREPYCERKGEKCHAHKALYEKIRNLGMTAPEYEEFSKEWNRARMHLRGCRKR